MATVRRKVVTAVFAVFITACGAGDTGPSSGTPAPRLDHWSGEWTVSLGQPTGPLGTACVFPSMMLILRADTMTDSLSGSHFDAGAPVCRFNDSLFSGPIPAGNVSGWFAGDSATILPDLGSFQVSAHVSGDSVTGSLAWTLKFGTSSPITVQGPIHGFRLPSGLTDAAPHAIQVAAGIPLIAQSDSARIGVTVENGSGAPLSSPTAALGVVDPTRGSGLSGGWIRVTGTEGPFLYSARAGSAYAEGVAIVAPGVARVSVTPGTATIGRQSAVRLATTLFDVNGDTVLYSTPRYASTDSAVVTVDSTGLVSSHGIVGHATILVRGVLVVDSVPVSVVSVPTAVTMSPDSAALAAGDTLRVSVVSTDQVGLPPVGVVPVFASTDTTVVTVTPDGLIQAQTPGPTGTIKRAQVIATIGSVADTSSVIVRVGPPLPVEQSVSVAADGALNAIAVASSGEIYVGGNLPGAVNQVYRGAVAGAAFQPILTIGNGAAEAIAFSPDGARGYVSRDSLGRVVVLDAGADTVLRAFAPPSGAANGLAITPDGSSLLVGTDDGNLFRYDAQNDSLLDSIPGLAAQYFAFAPGGAHVYVASGGVISDVDLTTFTVTRTIGTGSFWGLALSADGSTLYAGDASYGLRAFDAASGNQVNAVALGGAAAVAVVPSKDLIYVSNPSRGTMAVLDLPSLTVLEELPGLAAGKDIAVAPDGSTAIFAAGLNVELLR